MAAGRVSASALGLPLLLTLVFRIACVEDSTGHWYHTVPEVNQSYGYMFYSVLLTQTLAVEHLCSLGCTRSIQCTGYVYNEMSKNCILGRGRFIRDSYVTPSAPMKMIGYEDLKNTEVAEDLSEIAKYEYFESSVDSSAQTVFANDADIATYFLPAAGDGAPWWMIELDGFYEIVRVEVWPGCEEYEGTACGDEFSDVDILVLYGDFSFLFATGVNTTGLLYGESRAFECESADADPGYFMEDELKYYIQGDKVKFQSTTGALQISEVNIYGPYWI